MREVVRLAVGNEALARIRVADDGARDRWRLPRASGSKRWLTTTGPSATPARSSIANAVSMTSLTGVSSGSVTSITWQRAGSEMRSTTSWACLRIGPTRTASSSPRADSRNVIGMAGRGRVDDHEVGDARRLDRLHLAEHEDVLHARHGRRHDVERTRRREALRDALHPVRDEVVDEGGVGREEPGANARCRDRSRRSPAARTRRTSCRVPTCPRPRRSAPRARRARRSRPSAAVTVVFPTPPLPATMTTCDAVQKSATFIAGHGTSSRRAQLRQRPSMAKCPTCRSEPEPRAQLVRAGRRARDVDVDHRAAPLAHEVLMRRPEVVHGRPVSDVRVLDEPERLERFERAVHGREVNLGMRGLHGARGRRRSGARSRRGARRPRGGARW